MRLVRGLVSGMGRMVAASGQRVGLTGGGLLIEVDDEVPDRIWNADCWEETSNRWVEASGGGISRVFSAGDIARDKSALVRICEVVDAAEDFVSFPISASPFPPALDDSAVVSKDSEELARLAGCAESASEKLEANCFSPSDVSPIRFPAWDETPGAPLATNNNADANA